MKKYILLFIVFFILSCTTTKQTTRNELIFKGPISSNQNSKLVSNENRSFKDSLNYIIVKGKYISGSKHVEILQDKNTKLYYWKQYYPNGLLKEEGIMTEYNKICVGKWKFYSENGKLDSIKDYDKKLKISYYKALEIAKLSGYEMPELEVDLEKSKGKLQWQFIKWSEKDGSGNANIIFVDTQSGKISKPDYELQRQY